MSDITFLAATSPPISFCINYFVNLLPHFPSNVLFEWPLTFAVTGLHPHYRYLTLAKFKQL